MNRSTTLHFKKSGLQTTIQDKGRNGYAHLGVPVGGAMDKRAFQLANSLVGNPLSSPVLEITLLGPEIVFSDQCYIALTGGNLSPKINQENIPLNKTLMIRKGDRLTFGKIIQGCRMYLAVKGEWKIRKWLDSYSAASIKTRELTPDSIIRKDDKITISNNSVPPIMEYKAGNYLPNPGIVTSIRVLVGPEFHTFHQLAIARFFSIHFSIDNQSNRMGYRLKETIPLNPDAKPLISSAVLPGTIQINNAGQPIILMQDAQTTGGYYRIANILLEDMATLAQLKPGDQLRFQLHQ